MALKGRFLILRDTFVHLKVTAFRQHPPIGTLMHICANRIQIYSIVHILRAHMIKIEIRAIISMERLPLSYPSKVKFRLD